MPNVQIADVKDIKRALPLDKLSLLEKLVERLDERSYLFKDLWTPTEVSEFVGGQWSPSTVRRYASEGKIPSRKIGQLVMIPRERFVEEFRRNYDQNNDTE
jgi:hypothetical protein